ncbi:MAG: asparaginase [Turicibacter sp.]|nr:asparaginase [Turicibacter sp.]
MKKIAIIFTGGTISMTVDERLKAAIPAMDGTKIMSMVTNIDQIATLETVDFGKYPGPHMNPQRMMKLKALVKEKLAQPSIDGVVITHGTDNLEETAFLLDLTLPAGKPVVVVGAMRNGSELGYDGPSNLSAAICTAIHPESYGRGVLVVLNDEVNSAREVTKTHTMALDTFKSLDFGPIGIVDQQDVIFYRKGLYPSLFLETDGIEPDVHLLKAVSGMDSRLIDYLVTTGAKGIVIEAMGRGNVPPGMMPGIKKAIKNNIPIVIVSRCPKGRVLGTYGYEGGGADLEKAGAILVNTLNGQKARIQLMLVLALVSEIQQIKTYFM